MTIIAAVKKGGNVVIGADSYFGSNNFKCPFETARKIFQLGNAYIAIAGISALGNIIEDMQEEEPWSFIDVDSKAMARTLGAELIARMKKSIEDGTVENKAEEIAGGCFIIATATNIYQVADDLSCFEIDKFIAMGSGWNVCMGALQMEYRLTDRDNLSGLLRNALGATCELVPTCQLPITVMSCESRLVEFAEIDESLVQ